MRLPNSDAPTGARPAATARAGEDDVRRKMTRAEVLAEVESWVRESLTSDSFDRERAEILAVHLGDERIRDATVTVLRSILIRFRFLEDADMR